MVLGCEWHYISTLLLFQQEQSDRIRKNLTVTGAWHLSAFGGKKLLNRNGRRDEGNFFTGKCFRSATYRPGCSFINVLHAKIVIFKNCSHVEMKLSIWTVKMCIRSLRLFVTQTWFCENKGKLMQVFINQIFFAACRYFSAFYSANPIHAVINEHPELLSIHTNASLQRLACFI